MLSEDEIRVLKVVELKAELGKLGLPQTGKKDELIDRLLEHLGSNASAGGAKATSPVAAVAPAKPASVQAAKPSEQSATTGAQAANVVSTISEEEARRLARAARFGIDPTTSTTRTQDAKKSSSKQSFAADPSLISDEARQRRIERFGVVEPASKKSKHSTAEPALPKVLIGGGVVGLEDEKLKERQQRFGVTTSKILATQEMEEARRLRAERFGKQN